MRVMLVPGPKALTRIPCSASSRASHLVSWDTPALLAAYAPVFLETVRDVHELVLTMAPFIPRSIIDFATAWSIQKQPLRLMSMTRRHSSSVVLCTLPRLMTPALLKRMSICPYASSTSSTTLLHMA